jgi:hypothetical protein
MQNSKECIWEMCILLEYILQSFYFFVHEGWSEGKFMKHVV